MIPSEKRALLQAYQNAGAEESEMMPRAPLYLFAAAILDVALPFPKSYL